MQSTKNVKNEMYTETILVTPALALKWLEESVGCNPRKLNQVHINYLVQEILNGRWQESPQGLSFNPEGKNTDGQHRLWAVVLADKSVTMRATYNVPPEALEIIDGNIRPRALSVRINMGCHAAAMWRMMVTIVQTKTQIHPSQAYALEKVYGEYLARIWGECPTSAKRFSSTLVRLAAVMAMYQGEHLDYVTRVYRDLVLGHHEALARGPMDFWMNQIEGNKHQSPKEVYARARFAFTEANELRHCRMTTAYMDRVWDEMRGNLLDSLKEYRVLYTPIKQKAGFPKE